METMTPEKNLKKKTWITIDRNIPIPDLLEKWPELEEVLTYDYGFHCANCIFQGFDTLEDGARLHGIEGDYFEELLEDLEKNINSKKS